VKSFFAVPTTGRRDGEPKNGLAISFIPAQVDRPVPPDPIPMPTTGMGGGNMGQPMPVQPTPPLGQPGVGNPDPTNFGGPPGGVTIATGGDMSGQVIRNGCSVALGERQADAFALAALGSLLALVVTLTRRRRS
jgi:hypothetical protein